MKSLWLTLALGVTLSGMNTVNAREQTPAPASGPVDATAADDPFAWLEDIHAERSMAWVKQANAVTTQQFVDNPEFARTRDDILEVLDSDARIPEVSRMGDYLYNF